MNILLDCIHLSTSVRTEETFSSVMLIGLNPGLEALLLHFCPNVPMTNGRLLTTANVAVIDLHADDWGSFGKEVSLLTLLLVRLNGANLKKCCLKPIKPLNLCV